ncbi:MAG: hypothetical protein PHS84_13415 [Paludibacter sp.]|nr:hypothetical protein [Paludibacter sp.]
MNIDIKRLKYAILLLLAILTTKSQGDIIIAGQPAAIHARIINLNDYPDIAVFSVWDCLAVPKPIQSNRVESGSWIRMHILCPITLYAVKNKYIENLDVKEINWKDDQNILKSNLTIEGTTSDLPKSVRVVEIDYKIAGFNDTLMVLYKSKQVYKYGKFQPDSVKYFDYEGDLSKIRQNFN